MQGRVLTSTVVQKVKLTRQMDQGADYLMTNTYRGRAELAAIPGLLPHSIQDLDTTSEWREKASWRRFSCDAWHRCLAVCNIILSCNNIKLCTAQDLTSFVSQHNLPLLRIYHHMNMVVL